MHSLPIDPATVKLVDRIRPYLAAREISKEAAKQIEYAVNRLERFLKRRATLADLNAPLLNEWMLTLQEARLAPRTIRGYRGRILCLWNDALDEGLLDVEPRRLRRVKLPRFIPVAWSPEEVARVLQAAREVPGRFCRSRIPRALFWEAFILVLWDTALRFGDVLRLETSMVLGQERFRIVQHKTGDIVLCQLRAETVAAIKATYPPRRSLVFGGALFQERIGRQFGDIIRAAGLTTENGRIKMLRKSSATAVEAAHPGAAMRHLGHRTAGLAYKHYVDPRFISEAKPIAPALPGAAVQPDADEAPFLCTLVDDEKGGAHV